MKIFKISKGILILLCLSSFAHANVAELPEFSVMRFTNRASCALDSKLPTSSAFLLINNMDIARSIYRLAKSRGEDSTALTKKGIRVYRNSVIQILQEIHKRIVNRDLPLLPADATLESTPEKYKRVMSLCKNDSSCPELDDYLNSVWSLATNNIPGKIGQLQKIDSFNSQRHFLSKSVFVGERQRFEFSCVYLKKFSPLQAQVFGTKPTKEVLEQIGAAVSKPEEYISACDDFEKQDSVKVASFELELPNVEGKTWDSQGFDYWNSVKIYFSWAFRNAPEMKKIATPFNSLFSAVAIEDSVIILPNGCKSISMPKCEADYLNQNAIREFAKNDFKEKALSLDFLDNIPEGAQADLLLDPFTEVNKDVLDFSKFKTSDDWLENFRENFSGTRTLVRKNLLASVTFLDIVTKRIDPEKLTKKITNYFEVMNISSLEKTDKDLLKNELYYLCSEFSFAGNDQLSFIKNKLNLLKKVTLLDPVMLEVVDQSSATYFEYFDHLSKNINKMCFSLQQKKIWGDDFELDKTGYSPWYLNKVYQGKIKSAQRERQAEFLKSHPPSLAYAGYEVSKNIQDVVCASVPDCARKVIKSILDIYAATQYADTFWNLNNQIKTPALFNPYAERTACKVYDPWYKTKATMFGFATDVAQAGLAIVYPGVVFAKFDLQPGRVVSFNQLVSEGKIQYDTKYEKPKVTAGLALDFGKLLGVPCGISISRSDKMNPYNELQFQGIAVRACHSNESSTINVSPSNDISIDQNEKLSKCLVCSLNFEAVSSIASSTIPAASSAFFLVRAIFRLYKGFTDPLNIPHSWNVNPKLIKYAYDYYKGNIPKSCVRDLSKGRGCFKSVCENTIAEVASRVFRGNIVKIDAKNSYLGRASLVMSSCKKPLELKVHDSGINIGLKVGEGPQVCTLSLSSLPEECSGMVK